MAVLVLATGHQVRCMLWVQMATFNEGIGFLCGLKFFALNIFWASKDTCLLIQYVLEQGWLHPISSGNQQDVSSTPNLHFSFRI